MRANRADVVHLPRASLVAVGAGRKRADRADVDAHAALFAIQMIVLVGGDERADTAVLDAQRPDIHGLTANADTAITEDAARPIEKHHRRPLLLFFVVLGLHELRLGGTVRERHVLQFTLAARIAHRAIQRMVPEQQLDHGLARLTYFIAVGGDDHAFGNHRRTGGLQLGHLLDFDNAHAASALQRQVGVITKGGHFDARALACFNEQRPSWSCEGLAVDS